MPTDNRRIDTRDDGGPYTTVTSTVRDKDSVFPAPVRIQKPPVVPKLVPCYYCKELMPVVPGQIAFSHKKCRKEGRTKYGAMAPKIRNAIAQAKREERARRQAIASIPSLSTRALPWYVRLWRVFRRTIRL